MPEMLQKDHQETAEETITAPVEVEPAKKERVLMSKKQRRKLTRAAVAVVVVALLVAGGLKLLGKKGSSQGEMITDWVQYGSITSMVEGSGLTKAKTSETLTLATAGTVIDVFVTEGQEVEEGELLFQIDSPAAETAVQKARSNVEGIEKQLSAKRKDISGLNLQAPHAGKLMETVKLLPGDEFSGGVVAKLVDDTRMRLQQYYSYAYEGSLRAGQSVEVSIPALMTSVTGTVESVHMVSRITPEGSKLFEADIVIPNAGVLAADMVATATTTANGETVYPYEAGKLEYYRTTPLSINVSGTVISSGLVDYLTVSAGQMLVSINGENSEAEIFTIEQSLEAAREELESAEKNLANCRAVAPISGKVIGLSVMPGMEIPANTTLVTISDTSTITINATVDERNISYIQPGMPVELDQWGTPAFGTVESVSLSSTVNNGVATYPIVISADNYEGTIQVNSYIGYKLTASQNDNCLVLPVQAVRTVGLEDGSMAMVVYVSGDRPENAIEVPYADEEIPEGFWPVPVEIGIQDTYNVEIKSGVEEGMEVFTQMRMDSAWS